MQFERGPSTSALCASAQDDGCCVGHQRATSNVAHGSRGTSPESAIRSPQIAIRPMTQQASPNKVSTKAAGIVGLAVMCSRILGLIREQIFAGLFGGGRWMDAFTVAFR